MIAVAVIGARLSQYRLKKYDPKITIVSLVVVFILYISCPVFTWAIIGRLT
jgi:hypothetical protein